MDEVYAVMAAVIAVVLVAFGHEVGVAKVKIAAGLAVN